MKAVVRGIARRGFRKWYERELLRSHLQLVLLLLATIGALGALEAFSRGGVGVLMLLSLIAAAAIGAWALRRYLFYLMRAEVVANQATCSVCKAYGRFDVDASLGDDEASAPQGVAFDVCCRRCGHRWRIEC